MCRCDCWLTLAACLWLLAATSQAQEPIKTSEPSEKPSTAESPKPAIPRLVPQKGAPAGKPAIAPAPLQLARPMQVRIPAMPLIPAVPAGDLLLSLSVRASNDHPRFVLTLIRSETLESIRAELNENGFQTPPEIAEFLQSEVRQQIEIIEKSCSLTEQQVSKLQWAAAGEVNRISREAREWCDQYRGVSANGNQLELREAMAAMAALNDHLNQGLFRENSLFSNVLRTTLSNEQKQELVRQQFHDYLRSRGLDFTPKQREQLTGLFMHQHYRQEKPPVLWSGDYCLPLLLQINPAALALFLDEQQVATLRERPNAR